MTNLYNIYIFIDLLAIEDKDGSEIAFQAYFKTTL